MKPKCHPGLVEGSDRATSGVSLIIAIVFVSALLLVMAGLFEVQIKIIQNIGNREISGKAFYLAEGALEMAGLYASKHGIGMNAASPDIDFMLAGAASAGIQNCADMDANTLGAQPCVGFSVEGRPVDAQKVSFNGADFFSAPIRGSGDAAEDGVDCGAVPAADAAEADHPCNWNRMYLGQTVEIPLYYENDADGNGVIDPATEIVKLNFAGASPEEFRLRVRAQACEAGSVGCSADGRLILYPQVLGAADSAYRDPEKDPVLMQWSVFDAGGSGVVTAWDETAGGKRRIGEGAPVDYTRDNTEISAGRINLANGLRVLDLRFDHLEDFTVLKYINNPAALDFDKHRGKNSNKQTQAIGSFIATPAITKPTLRLSLVGQLQRSIAQDNTVFTYPASLNDRERFDIPYLEYQLLTKNSPPADSKSLIIGWAEIGGFRKEFRKYIKRATSASGFAIESY